MVRESLTQSCTGRWQPARGPSAGDTPQTWQQLCGPSELTLGFLQCRTVTLFPEIIGETPLLLNELCGKELLSALEMIESPTLFENVSKMGLENAKKYTSQSMIDGYRNIYSELLE